MTDFFQDLRHASDPAKSPGELLSRDFAPTANAFRDSLINAMCDAISDTLDVVVGFTLAGENIWIAEVHPLSLIEIIWNEAQEQWEVQMGLAKSGPKCSLWFNPDADPIDPEAMRRYCADGIREFCERVEFPLPNEPKPYCPPRSLYRTA